MGQLTKDGETLIDLLACQRLQPFCAEALHGERSHHPAIEHRVLENVARDFALRRDVAHEATGEAVARTGGVAHFFQRQRRSSERMMTSSKLPVAEEDSRAVLGRLLSSASILASVSLISSTSTRFSISPRFARWSLIQ